MDTFKEYYHAARANEALDLLDKTRDLRDDLIEYYNTAVIDDDKELSETALAAADAIVDALQKVLLVDRS